MSLVPEFYLWHLLNFPGGSTGKESTCNVGEAEESVAWRYYKTAAEAVAALKADGYTVLAVEQCHGSTMLNDFKPAFGDKKKYAVVLGNEVKGVHQEVVDMCDGCLEIPQYGTKHSLNVSVTAGIVIWHFASSNL